MVDAMTAPTNRPVRLQAEHLGSAPLGIWVRPRLSWWLPAGAARQVAYEVGLGDGRTARSDSGQQVLTPWPFEPLRSRERVTWRVRVWTDADPTEWSEWASIEVGLIDPTDWSARWIEPDEVDRQAPGERPAWLLRQQFDVESPGSARMHATAHGVDETFLNGRRGGRLHQDRHELHPSAR